MHLSIGILVALLAPQANYEPDFVALFHTLEYRYTGGGYRDELFTYRLFVPEMESPSDKKPLVVWLNGHGEAGRDNVLQLRYLSQLVFRPPHERRHYPFFFLAIQSPPENPDWTVAGSKLAADDMVNVVLAILGQAVRDYPIDRDRIYLAGISSGGNGCWELAARSPGRFAAVAPISSNGADQEFIGRYGRTPFWVFNCSLDASTPIERVRRSVEMLKQRGGNVHLTEIDSKLHDAWTAAFEDYHLLDWLLSQRRGYVSPAPGTIPLATRLRDFAAGWRWWQLSLQVGILAVVCLAAWKAVRHRRRMRPASQRLRGPR